MNQVGVFVAARAKMVEKLQKHEVSLSENKFARLMSSDQLIQQSLLHALPIFIDI